MGLAHPGVANPGAVEQKAEMHYTAQWWWESTAGSDGHLVRKLATVPGWEALGGGGDLRTYRTLR